MFSLSELFELNTNASPILVTLSDYLPIIIYCCIHLSGSERVRLSEAYQSSTSRRLTTETDTFTETGLATESEPLLSPSEQGACCSLSSRRCIHAHILHVFIHIYVLTLTIGERDTKCFQDPIKLCTFTKT